jgi:hypothetical protein
VAQGTCGAQRVEADFPPTYAAAFALLDFGLSEVCITPFPCSSVNEVKAKRAVSLRYRRLPDLAR